MSQRYIETQVNIEKLPKRNTSDLITDGSQVTIGDMHGNALKMLFALYYHGFVDISAENYAKFLSLYYKSRLNKDDLTTFNTILSEITVNPAARKAKLDLIGDVLADRGMNDYYTLRFLKLLKDNGVPFGIEISNHDAEFIRMYEKELPYQPEMLGRKQANSSYNLQSLIKNKLVERQEVDGLYEECYKPNLKALSYILNETQDKITIYSHAPIDTNTIKQMATQMGVIYLGDDPLMLAQAIDDINSSFSEYVKRNEVTSLLNIDEIDHYAIDGVRPIDSEKFPFAFAIWNRRTDELNRNNPQHEYVHGHDREDKTEGNIYNLDNILGKLPERETNQGIYNVLYTDNIKSALVLPVETEEVAERKVNEQPKLEPITQPIAIKRKPMPLPNKESIPVVPTTNEKTPGLVGVFMGYLSSFLNPANVSSSLKPIDVDDFFLLEDPMINPNQPVKTAKVDYSLFEAYKRSNFEEEMATSVLPVETAKVDYSLFEEYKRSDFEEEMATSFLPN